jgi:SPP1 family phage portal protein
MTIDELQKALNTANVPKTITQAMERRAYYDGKHPAIYRDGPKESPDNRVPIPIVRKAVKQVLGYAFRPGSIVYSGDAYDNILKAEFDANEETLLTPELAETALIHGRAFELHWTDEGSKRFAQIPIGQAFPIYSEDIVPKMIGFIRYWMDDTGTNHAVVYDDMIIQEFEQGRNGWQVIDEQSHGYKSVPVVEYCIAPDKSNLFDHVLALVDLLDRSMSEDVANELQRFANAYLLLASDISQEEDDNGETEIDKIKRTKVFARLGDNVLSRVQFLTKTIDPTFINTALDRVERLIYEMLAVPNPSDDVFNAQTGIALEYKLQPFEYLVATICAYFARGLQQRIRLMLTLDSTINGVISDASDVGIHFMRNKPDDIGGIADTMIKLSSFVSQETLLKLLPSSVVEDVQEELARMGETVEAFDNEPVEGEQVDTEGTVVVAEDNVQATALNGAQVTSLQGIAQSLANGELPYQTAIELVMIAFPTISRDTAERMMKPADNFAPARTPDAQPAQA